MSNLHSSLREAGSYVGRGSCDQAHGYDRGLTPRDGEKRSKLQAWDKAVRAPLLEFDCEIGLVIAAHGDLLRHA